MLLIGIVAAVVIIAGVAGYLLMKTPAKPPVTPGGNETPAGNQTGGGEGTGTGETTTTAGEGDTLTNVPSGISGTQEMEGKVYVKETASGGEGTADISEYALEIDKTSGNFELQVLLPKSSVATKSDAEEIGNAIATRLKNWATSVTVEVIEGSENYKLVIKGVATDVDKVVDEVSTLKYY